MNKFDNATADEMVAAMAEAMIHHGDGCTIDQLKSDGFNKTQIDTHGDAAREHAMTLTERYQRKAVPARHAA